MSIRTKDQFKEQACLALVRAKFKIPGRMYVKLSDKWGFTKMKREEYLDLKE
jgi:large subunit ribosomal protein L10e